MNPCGEETGCVSIKLVLSSTTRHMQQLYLNGCRSSGKVSYGLNCVHPCPLSLCVEALISVSLNVMFENRVVEVVISSVKVRSLDGP